MTERYNTLNPCYEVAVTAETLRFRIQERFPNSGLSQVCERLESIHDANYWPPGSIMIYDSVDFTGFGLVVANNGEYVSVLWDYRCKFPFRSYKIGTLNPSVIRRDCEKRQ